MRPFLSDKYDITKHPRYKLLADYDKRNAFDIEKYRSHKLVVKPTEEQTKVLVVYFSATGSTKAVAGYIAETLGADTFELTPQEPYLAADLDYNNSESRVCREHADPALQDVALTSTAVESWERYDTVFVGYPIWWGGSAWPVNGFVKANDFTGKTVIPFCTSASSALGQSGETLAQLAGTGDWQEGQRFPSAVTQQEVTDWVKSLGK